MKMKQNIALAALGMALGTVLIFTQAAWSDREDQPFKLQGSWVATVPGTPLSWMYTFAPSDPSGQEAALHANLHLADATALGAFPEAEYVSGCIGEAAVTRPNQAAFTTLYYGMKKGVALPEKVYIVLDSGTIKKTGPSQTEVSHNFGVYLPGQDADGDGLPDKGQVPIACVSYVSLDTRLPLLPPCTPPPAP